MTYLEKIDIEKESLARREAVDFAINNFGLEGVEILPEFEAITLRYVNLEITAAEMLAEGKRLLEA